MNQKIVISSTLAALFLISFLGCSKQENFDTIAENNPEINDRESKLRKHDTMNEPSQENDRPMLEVKLNLEKDKLLVTYLVKNNRSVPIYILNIIEGQAESDQENSEPHHVYSALRSDGVFHMALQCLPLPTSELVESRIIPYATKLAAGGEFSGKFQVDIPAPEYNPYFPKTEESKLELRNAKSVLFSLQYIEESDELKPTPLPDDKGFVVWHPNLFGNLVSLTSKQTVSFDVNKRLDAFDEF